MSEVTKVEVFPLKNPKGKVIGIGRIILNGDIFIDGVKILTGDKGWWVGMPATKNQEGKFPPHAGALTKELKEKISKAVLDEFKAKTSAREDSASSNTVEEDDDLPF